MRLISLPDAANEALTSAMTRYLRGTGRRALMNAGIAPESIQARGAIREAYVKVNDRNTFLGSGPGELDRYFQRFRVFLFSDENAIGSVCLRRADTLDEYEAEYVALDRQSPREHQERRLDSAEPDVRGSATTELMEALSDLEFLSQGDDREPRLVLFPQLYLSFLMLVGSNTPRIYRVIGRREASLPEDWTLAEAAEVARSSREQFAEFLEAAVAHHQSVFAAKK